MNYYHFIDVSEYNEHTLEDLRLLKSKGVRHVIIRAGVAHSEDNRLPEWVELCRQAGLSYSLYFYFYPGLAARSQVELFIVLIEQYPDCRSVWIDIEEHASPITKVEYSPDTLNAFYKTVFTMVKDAFPGKIVGNYSGGWVLEKYLTKFAANGSVLDRPYERWINTAPYWNAAYVKYHPWFQNYIASLGGSWDGPTRQISIDNLPAIMEKISQSGVPVPIGIDKVIAWQCVTFLPLRELIIGSNDWKAHLDHNLIYQNDWLFGDLPEEGEIIMTVTNAATNTPLTTLRVRSGPSTSSTILKGLPDKTRVNVVSGPDANNWLLINQPLYGYVSAAYVFLDPVVTPPPLPVIDCTEDIISALEEVKAHIDSMIERLGL